ncbi:MAG: chloride channel protein [Anaerolineae bacterium]|nr:chloride channel protein [Anaerolineae bacterium]
MTLIHNIETAKEQFRNWHNWWFQRNNFDLRDHLLFLRGVGKWLLLGGLVGICAGLASALFLVLLAEVTRIRIGNPLLILLLPAAGFVLGWIYLRFSGTAARGSNLVVEAANAEENSPYQDVPLRMAPLVLIGTLITHLFGGSAGREGTAVQMGTALADTLRRTLGLTGIDRRLMIMAGISGGFASVFGTPAAGFLFGLEVRRAGGIRYDAIVPCFSAAVVGDWVVRTLGVSHAHHPVLMPAPDDPLLLVKVVIAGIAFGLTSLLFIEGIHFVKRLSRRWIPYPPLRLVAGGVVVVGLTLLFKATIYNGLSDDLITMSVEGLPVPTLAFLLKLILTAVTLGAGFIGGEVTPLFVIGSTLGATLAPVLGVDQGFLASLGFVAVFAGASNTPLACVMMGVELFGGNALIMVAIACFTAYLASGHRGIYASQLIAAPKAASLRVMPEEGESLEEYSERRSNQQFEPPAER